MLNEHYVVLVGLSVPPPHQTTLSSVRRFVGVCTPWAALPALYAGTGDEDEDGDDDAEAGTCSLSSSRWRRVNTLALEDDAAAMVEVSPWLFQ